MSKRLNCLLAPVALAAGLVWAPSATAALVFNGSYAGNNTFIGDYNPTASDSALFNNGTLGLGAFTDTWIFNLSPAGQGTINANFIPGFPNADSITGFTVTLYNVSAATCGALGVACSSITLGGPVAVGVPGNSSSSIGFLGLSAGYYAFRITGTVVSTPTLYSGQLTTRANPVPEPGSLALLGLALGGLGFSLRRRSV